MNLQPVFKPHHSGLILAYRIIYPLRFYPLVIVCVLTKKETLILNPCCLLFGFPFPSRCLANYDVLTKFSLFYCEERVDRKDYNYYKYSMIKKQYYACFSLVFHFLPILNWLKKKIKQFSQSITKFPQHFMKLLSRAAGTVVEPSVRGFRTTTAFRSKPGLAFPISIVSPLSLEYRSTHILIFLVIQIPVFALSE